MTVRTTVTERSAPIPAFSLSIIHDIRNPMATIRAGSEVLMRAGIPDPQMQRIVRHVQGASLRMQELLDELFEQYRGVRREPELTDVRDLAMAAVERIAERAEAQSVRILQDIPEGLVIPVDRHRIQRVLVNLLWNALEVMPDGGTIELSAVSEPHTVLLQVRDTGPGIAPEVSGRLFQPFATAGKAGGMGLGLACSRQAIIDHGGEMWAESSRQGALFSVRLPGIPSPLDGSC